MFTKKEVLRFVEENDVKFVRLAFCDLLGVVKNVSIMASELSAAFEKGVKIHAEAIDGFARIGKGELLLIPDPATISMLPWRPRASGVVRLFCDVVLPDGASFVGDGRRLLENVVVELHELGAACEIGTDCQFYLFETDEKGRPTKTAIDDGEYLDVAPLDKGEDIRRDICLTLESLGMEPTLSHHEKGPGQNEIDFKHGEPIAAADNFLIFKLLVKAISARNGVYATFIPSPVKGAPASWLNLDLKIAAGEATKSNFTAGVINRLDELTLFLSPSVDVYETGAVSPASARNSDALKLRGLDPTCNPYLALALLLRAGIEGIKNAEDLSCVPTKKFDFDKAFRAASASVFVKSALPKELLDAYLDTVKDVRRGYVEAEDKDSYAKKLYFEKM